MKLMVISLLFSILLLSNVYALRINEVEANPSGTDSGNEWIEFYNDGTISLDGYIIVNNDGYNISLNGSFNGYFVYNFATQWLDNTNESVYLYKDSLLIDKTEILADSNNDGLSRQFCGADWKFLNSTKGQENNCPASSSSNSSSGTTSQSQSSSSSASTSQNSTSSSTESTDTTTQTSQNSQSQSSDFIPSSNSLKTNANIDSEIILLTPAKKNTEESSTFVTKDEKIRIYALYSLIALMIVIIIFLAFKKL